MNLSDSIAIIDDIEQCVKQLDGSIGTAVKTKFAELLRKNVGFKSIASISKIINGESCDDDIIEKLSIEDLSSFKFAPITTCHIERSFSQYKHVLEGRDLNWEFDNLKKTFMLYCNNQKLM